MARCGRALALAEAASAGGRETESRSDMGKGWRVRRESQGARSAGGSQAGRHVSRFPKKRYRWRATNR